MWLWQFYFISFQISYTDWPSDIFRGDFYDTYISGKPFEHRYANLRSLDPTNITNIDLLLAERLVKTNFLSAYIYSHLMVHEYQDTPKLTLPALLSQLGAALNWWAGITIVVVIELIEFIYEVLCWRNKNNAI